MWSKIKHVVRFFHTVFKGPQHEFCPKTKDYYVLEMLKSKSFSELINKSTIYFVLKN